MKLGMGIFMLITGFILSLVTLSVNPLLGPYFFKERKVVLEVPKGARIFSSDFLRKAEGDPEITLHLSKGGCLFLYETPREGFRVSIYRREGKISHSDSWIEPYNPPLAWYEDPAKVEFNSSGSVATVLFRLQFKLQYDLHIISFVLSLVAMVSGLFITQFELGKKVARRHDKDGRNMTF